MIKKMNVVPLLLLIVLFAKNDVAKVRGFSDRIDRNDTISGYFLFEVNVPKKCFTRFDQIEQGNNLINYDASIATNDVGTIYEKGVFCLSPQPFIEKFFLKGNPNLTQNRKSVDSFVQLLNPFMHENDSAFNKSLIKDKSGLLSYKKVYARFCILKLGNVDQLVPQTINYRCCYANYKRSIKTFYIKDILEYKIF